MTCGALPQALGFAVAAFVCQAPLPRGQAGACLVARLGRQGGLAQQFYQAVEGILPVLLLGAVAPGVDEQRAIAGDAAGGQGVQAQAHLLGQGGGIEPELRLAGYLIDVFAEFLFSGSNLRIGLFTGLAEILFLLWLLIKGVNVEKWEKRAHESA